MGVSGLPRLVIAAPASGSGKTTVATGLMAALAARGLAVSPHKVGPDYIDPGYHALAAGRPGRNLDVHLCGEDLIASLFRHGARGADVAVVEGVMGLFDGASGGGEFASTAHVAKVLAAPIVLVVDAAAQARSVAALVHGFACYDPDLSLGGVILNRVGSAGHERLLRDALDPLGIPVLGALRRCDAAMSPSRHLGLVPAAERSAEAARAVRALGDLVLDGCDLDRLFALARTAPPLTAAPWDPESQAGPPVSGRPRVAVGGGAAFTFGYRENVELLQAAGADVVPLDPLDDTDLPERTRAIVLGGGFPEMYGAELSANEPLRRRVADLAARGVPIAAECAGLLYLARSLDGHPMCGMIDAEVRMTARLTLGYRRASAPADSPLAPAGAEVNGHEFHRTSAEPRRGTTPAWRLRGRGYEGFAVGQVHASYLHLHWAGRPEIARRLVAAAVSSPDEGTRERRTRADGEKLPSPGPGERAEKRTRGTLP